MTGQIRPLISVVIPAYNAEGFIADALASVIAQDYPNTETIVVDDASTDATEEVVRNHPLRCHYVRNSANLGPSASRNRGIREATGRYVAFLDADDAWLPGKLALQVALLESDEYLTAVGAIMLPWETAASTGPFPPNVEVERFSFADMVLQNRLATPTVIAPRAALLKAGLYNETLHMSEDYDLWLRLVRLGTVARLTVPLARYRSRPDGLSAGNRDRTYALSRQYIETIATQYKDYPGIRQLVRRARSAHALDDSIEQLGQSRHARALQRLVESFLVWPWNDPTGAGRRFIRVRRARTTLRGLMT